MGLLPLLAAVLVISASRRGACSCRRSLSFAALVLQHLLQIQQRSLLAALMVRS
jgi:hypothetical protein